MEKVVWVTDCGDTTPSDTLVALLVVDTDVPDGDPADIDAVLGVLFLSQVAQTENNNGDITQREYQFEDQPLGCDMISLGVTGFAKATFSDPDRQDDDNPWCVQSGNAKALGDGDVDDESAVLESLNTNAGARSRSIEVDAGDANDAVLDYLGL
jgi:hypothetical protein